MAFLVDARGMRCPWPALRAARAMRGHALVEVHADDPVAGRELEALATERGWQFSVVADGHFRLVHAGAG
ncbi:MAG: sulfurtransferase TusA family protein [Sphingobium sp.]